jgi:hypothetical protein
MIDKTEIHNVSRRSFSGSRINHGRNVALKALVFWAIASSFGVTACGSTNRGLPLVRQSPSATTVSVTTASSAAGTPRLHEDQDKDIDIHVAKGYFDADDYNTPNYPRVANMTDARAVRALVKRYVATAAANDGASACSLIYSLFAEEIPETYGLPPTGSPALHGTTCAVVMTKLFKLHHSQLAAEAATVEVVGVRVNGNRGLALLHFRGIPARSIDVHRERGVWKINALLDTEVS